jgi:hypothetical protein
MPSVAEMSRARGANLQDSVARGTTPELALLLCIARSCVEAEDVARLQDRLAGRPLDWHRLAEAAAWHRLIPLLHHHLASLPADLTAGAPSEQIRRAFLQNASWTLQRTGTLIRILRLLDSQGIPAVPYKGPALAERVYGKATLRMAGDLDVLIRKRDIARAREVLLAAGFTPVYSLTEALRAFQQASRYDEKFFDQEGTCLELHWRFVNQDVEFELALDDLLPRLEMQSLAGNRVQGMGTEDLILILSIHGAKHRWDRLEWLASVGELIRELDRPRWQIVLDRAQALGARRVLLLTSELANRLLNVPIPDQVAEAIRREVWVRRLGQEVQGRLLDPEHADRGFVGMLSRNLFQLPLQEGTRRRVKYLAYRLTTPHKVTGWRAVRVAGHSFTIHTLTWPARLVYKLVTRGKIRRPGGSASLLSPTSKRRSQMGDPSDPRPP